MEDIALTNTLLESKINIYDENSNLISSTNNQNNSINNNNSFNTNNSITSSNITEQITLRKNNNTNNSNNTNKKSNHHFHHHSKQKYNLPVEIIDYDNIEDNNKPIGGHLIKRLLLPIPGNKITDNKKLNTLNLSVNRKYARI